MTTATALTPGVYLVGELIGIEQSREFKGRDGDMHLSRPKVRLLVGTRLEVVPFKDEAALRAVLNGAKDRDIVTLPVYLNGPYDEATRRSTPHNAEYSGRAPRTETGDDE